MQKRALILLCGEQPLPNLLPTRHLQPDMVALVHTSRTREIAERIGKLLSVQHHLCAVDPYAIPQIVETLEGFLTRHVSGYEWLFNLTGGTKPMSIAALLIASRRKAPMVYFQTEGGRSLLYFYRINEQGDIELEKQEELLETICLNDYLRTQIGDYTSDRPRNKFEEKVYQTLQEITDLEILTSVRPQGLEALEVDFVIRLGNQVGVIEAKTKGAKSGIDQIQAVAEQRYLGTYVAKFLVSGERIDPNNRELAKAYHIELIELPSYGKTEDLNEEDKEELKQRIRERLGGR